MSSDSQVFVLPVPVNVPVFDVGKVYDARVAGRQIVYLDQNVWIELRDAKTPNSAAARDACLSALAEGRAIFPLSYAAISELSEIQERDARQRLADLMDLLSRGVCLRTPALVYAVEAEAVYRHLFHGEAPGLRRREAYTSVPDHVGNGSLFFRAGTPLAAIRETLAKARTNLTVRSARWLVDHLDLEQIRRNHQGTYARDMNEAHARDWARFANGRKIDREAVLTWERAQLFMRHVLPVVRRALFAEYGPEGGGGSKRAAKSMAKAVLVAFARRSERLRPDSNSPLSSSLLAPCTASDQRRSRTSGTMNTRAWHRYTPTLL